MSVFIYICIEKERIEIQLAHLKLVTWKDTMPSALQSLQGFIGHDRFNQKIQTADRRFRTERQLGVDRRLEVARTKVRCKQ